MTIGAGTRLGPYEVLAPIGSGGMGEVYRARDPKLGRDVAIKVLSEDFASDPERLARFRREAQALAALNHPNIGAIYGLEEYGLVDALVLELIEGDTLAEHLARGPIPVPEALAIARQIANALESAHEKGIVHRDLKPANVKLTPGGEVKVLDFGLAKALSADPSRSSPDLTHSPTLTAAGTQAGVVIGTAAYMSPEQARGRSVDKRADIWAFGAILWEMLTGRRLFEGETVTDILAAVLRQEIEFAALPADTPSGVVRLLHRCLERDPKNRLHDIADARLEIEESAKSPARASQPDALAKPAEPRRISWLPWLWAVAATIAALTLAFLPRSPSNVSVAEPVRLSVALGSNLSLEVTGDQTQILTISPDGRRVAFRGSNGEDHRVFVRDLAHEIPEPVSGSEGAADPFFSPDGEWVGMVSGDKLKKTAIRGGAPVILADAPRSRGAVWSEDGTIVFAPTVNTPLFRVPAAGGETRALTKLDAAARERSHRWPEAVGREWILFTVGTEDKPGDYTESRIDAVSLATGKRHMVYRGASFARFAPPDHLLVARRGDIFAVPFDPKSAEARGPAVPVVQGVSGDARSGVAYFGVSKTGSLVYALGLSVQGAREIVWADRNGRREPAGIPSGNYTGISLSPDGHKLAYAAGPGGGARSDIWIADLVHSSHFQLTSTGQAQSPCWTPDGSSVVFVNPTGDILRQRADGSSAAEVLWRTPYRVPAAPDSFVPDGSALLFTVSGLPSRADLFLLPLSGERKARVLISTPEAEHQAMISPNGRWLAYAGEYEAGARIYVQPYPSLAGRWLIAPTGGAAPRWSRDGKELFYMWNDQIFAVSIAEGATFTPGEPRPVFKIERPADLEWNDIYDVAPDGKFLLLQRQKEANQSSRLDVVLNFSKTLAAGDSKAP